MVCISLGSLLRPLFYFLCSNLKANPVGTLAFASRQPSSNNFAYQCTSGETESRATAPTTSNPLPLPLNRTFTTHWETGKWEQNFPPFRFYAIDSGVSRMARNARLEEEEDEEEAASCGRRRRERQ